MALTARELAILRTPPGPNYRDRLDALIARLRGFGIDGRGPVSGGRGIEVGIVIPDTSMFQSPIYQFYAGEAGESEGTTFVYPEVLAGLSDATAVGDPLIQRDVSDGDGDSWDAGEYDGTDDGHDWMSDSQLPVNDETFSIAALVWVRSGTGKYAVFNWGRCI